MRRVNEVTADVPSAEGAGCDRWELDWTSPFTTWLRAAGGSSIRSLCHRVMFVSSATVGMRTYAYNPPGRLRKWSVSSTYPQPSLYSCNGAVEVESLLTRVTSLTTGQSEVCIHVPLTDLLIRFSSHRMELKSLGSSVYTLVLVAHP